MSDPEPMDEREVPNTADFQQKDADQLKDAVERALRDYVDQHAGAITSAMTTVGGGPDDIQAPLNARQRGSSRRDRAPS